MMHTYHVVYLQRVPLFALVLTIYGVGLISLSQCLSTLFSNSKVATNIGTLLIIAPLALFYATGSTLLRSVLSILPQVAMLRISPTFFPVSE